MPARKVGGKDTSADKKMNASRNIAKKKVPSGIAKKKPPLRSARGRFLSLAPGTKPLSAAAGKKATTKKPAPQRVKATVASKVPGKVAAASKTASAKKAAPAAAAPLRRNTTLQTRGKEEDSKLRPKSRTTGAPVVAKKPEPKRADSSSRSKKRSTPPPSDSGAPAKVARVDRGKEEDIRLRPTSRTTGAPVVAKKPGTKQADSSSRSKKRSAPPSSDSGESAKVARVDLSANVMAAAQLLCSLSSGPKVAHAADKTRVVPKARPSGGGAAAQKVPATNASASSSLQDKGKAQADPQEPKDTTAAGGVGGPSSSNTSDVRKEVAPPEPPAVVEPKPRQELKKFYAYSRLGSKKKRLSFTCSGDRREKKVYWQAQEIEALENLVPLYRNKDTGKVYWCPLLRENAGKFAVCRTDVDLKDKWRNMMKRKNSTTAHVAAETTGLMALKALTQGNTAEMDRIGEPSSAASSSRAGGSAEGGAGGSAGGGAPAAFNEHYNSIHFRKSADPSRKRAKWSPEEMALLERGIKECGTHWTKILLGYNGFNDCRTSLDLKDKWRNMCKSKPSASSQ